VLAEEMSHFTLLMIPSSEIRVGTWGSHHQSITTLPFSGQVYIFLHLSSAAALREYVFITSSI